MMVIDDGEMFMDALLLITVDGLMMLHVVALIQLKEG